MGSEKNNGMILPSEPGNGAVLHIPLHYEAHADLKKRVPGAISLIRTGDTIKYANMLLVSGLLEPGGY